MIFDYFLCEVALFMRWFKKVILLFMLLSICSVMTSCGENLDLNGGGYKEDIDNHGRYKGELSYNQLLKHYKRYYYEDQLKSAKKWKNTMLAIGLSKYYHLNNELINFENGPFDRVERDLFNMHSLEDVGDYLHIQNDSLKDLTYKFSYYYSPHNREVFSVLKFYLGSKQLAIYYFPNNVDKNFDEFNLFDKDLHNKVFSDGYQIIDGTDFGLHLNGKVVPKYIKLLSGQFYPYLYLYDFLYDLRYYDAVDLSFVKKDAILKNINYLKYYASTRRHLYQIYFNMDDLLNYSKNIKGIVAIKHRFFKTSTDYYGIEVLDDVYSFTLDTSDGIKNCKLKQLSLYN